MTPYMVYRVGGTMPVKEFKALYEVKMEVVRLQSIKGYKGATFRIMSTLYESKPKEDV